MAAVATSSRMPGTRNGPTRLGFRRGVRCTMGKLYRQSPAMTNVHQQQGLRFHLGCSSSSNTLPTAIKETVSCTADRTNDRQQKELAEEGTIAVEQKVKATEITKEENDEPKEEEEMTDNEDFLDFLLEVMEQERSGNPMISRLDRQKAKQLLQLFDPRRQVNETVLPTRSSEYRKVRDWKAKAYEAALPRQRRSPSPGGDFNDVDIKVPCSCRLPSSLSSTGSGTSDSSTSSSYPQHRCSDSQSESQTDRLADSAAASATVSCSNSSSSSSSPWSSASASASDHESEIAHADGGSSRPPDPLQWTDPLGVLAAQSAQTALDTSPSPLPRSFRPRASSEPVLSERGLFSTRTSALTSQSSSAPGPQDLLCEICYQPGVDYPRTCCRFLACRPCLVAYVTGKVLEGQARIQCPRCCCLMLDSEVLDLLATSALRARWRQFLVDASCDPNLKTCPSCGLPHPFPAEYATTSRRKLRHGVPVTCSACALQWCFTCHAPWHDGLTCSKFRKGDNAMKTWAKELESQGFRVQKNAQRCPGCKTCGDVRVGRTHLRQCDIQWWKGRSGAPGPGAPPSPKSYIQRSSGCAHMKCIKCKTDFCYNCGDRYFGYDNKVFRLLIGNHHSKYSPLGCRNIFLPENDAKRRLIRGSLTGARLMGCLAAAAGVVVLGTGAAALLVALGVVAGPIYGGFRLQRSLLQRRRHTGGIARHAAHRTRTLSDYFPDLD